MKALDDIELYQEIGSNIQVKDYLYQIKKDLKHMVLIVHIKREILTQAKVISDITYCWECLKDYNAIL